MHSVGLDDLFVGLIGSGLASVLSVAMRNRSPSGLRTSRVGSTTSGDIDTDVCSPTSLPASARRARRYAWSGAIPIWGPTRKPMRKSPFNHATRPGTGESSGLNTSPTRHASRQRASGPIRADGKVMDDNATSRSGHTTPGTRAHPELRTRVTRRVDLRVRVGASTAATAVAETGPSVGGLVRLPPGAHV